MTYVQPGESAPLAPGQPPTVFPLGGYVADYFGTDPTLLYAIDYTPSAVTGDLRAGGLLYVPDDQRYKGPKPVKGYPLLVIPNGQGWQTIPPIFNVVPNQETSNIAHAFLDAGWAVWICGANGPNSALAIPNHGTDDIAYSAATGVGWTPPADYQHHDAPTSTPQAGGTEYVHDTSLSYLKQAQWMVQYVRERVEDGDWSGLLNMDVTLSLGVSAGTTQAWWQVYGPDMIDPAMSDMRKFSSRTTGCLVGAPPFWYPALLQTEGNVYGYPLPLASDPTGDDCSAVGWLSCGVPGGLVTAVELSLHNIALGSYANRWSGAPDHAAVVARSSSAPFYAYAARNDPFNYGATTPTQWALRNGTGALRTFLAINGMTTTGAGTGHSSAWVVQLAAAMLELDGSTDPAGFHRTHSRTVLPHSPLAALAGHTTSADANAPYDPIPLAHLIDATLEDVEDLVDGNLGGFTGYLGSDAVAWATAWAKHLDPGYALGFGESGDDPSPPAPEPVKVQSYTAQAQGHLPPGLAWTRQLDSNLTKFLRALADEYSRVDDRAAQLLEEADPRSTTELLAEWEDLLGLPSPCLELGPTELIRRFAVVTRLTTQGGQTPQTFVDVAAKLGYTIEVEEHAPFQCGVSECTDPLGDEEFWFGITIHAPEATWTLARTGEATTGEPLTAFGNTLLECVLTEIKPAHAKIAFSYDLPVNGYAPWTEILPQPVDAHGSVPVWTVALDPV